jgi:subtilase family serine protease
MTTQIPNPLQRNGLIFGILLFALAGAQAQIVNVGGPLVPGHARPPLWLHLRPASTTASTPPYTPQQIRHAYGFDLLTAGGAGQTIAVVDAYGSQSAQRDLNAFCSYFGIPSTTLVIAHPQGKTGANTGWAEETSLDVQWAHAIAPNARILLVVAKNSGLNNLLGAVDYAVAHGASVVSMSWGAGEFSGETVYDSHFAVNGVTFVASSGDNGESSGVEWPAASPYVVGVGGTSLILLDTLGAYGSETAWSGSGGGISIYEPAPAFQTSWQSTGFRTVPDVSYVADPNTGVYVVYQNALYEFGGTSVGAPQWAALVALSNSQRASGTLSRAGSAIFSLNTPPTINSNYLHDIILGSDGGDPDDVAGLGYDFVTGLGSPVANNLAPALSSK